MKKKFTVFAFIFFLLSLLVWTDKKSTSELPQRFKIWLEEEVVYIISSLEKDVFLRLETDRERDLFIEAFWKHRDPTQGTPKNEFREEHYRRLSYANYHFGRGVPKPGWKTDQGRIYIILGEPRDIERLTGETQIYNAEIWFYQGLTKYGLPPGFNLVFYQRGGMGEYVLYSPLNDGPQALMTSYFGDQADYLAAFRTLKKINPTLARVSLSLIPGESARFGRPSLASDLMLQNIHRVPQKDLKERYAEKFLMYKDIVEVEYTANYIDNDHSVKILKDPSGIYFVHYVVELMRFSVQQYQGEYSTHLKINGNVTDLGGKTIFQYEDSFSVKFDETELKQLSYRPFDLYDMFPLLPGSYKLSVIVKNEVSKEFTSIEKDISIPEAAPDLQMSSLILGYKTEHISSVTDYIAPFRIGQDQIYFQPMRIFLPDDKLFLVFQILSLSPDLHQRGAIKFEIFNGEEKVFSVTKKVSDYQDRLNFKEEFFLKEFKPAHYRIKVALLDGEQELLSKWEEFDVTSVSMVPRPWVYYKKISPSSDPIYTFILGRQFLNKGETDKAQVLLEKAYYSQPNSLNYAVLLAQTYFIQKKFTRVKQILIPFLETHETPYIFYLLLGGSYQKLVELSQAINIYDEAISRFGINIKLLNSLGECYYLLGNVKEALAAWEKSLELKPDQTEIQKKIESIKK